MGSEFVVYFRLGVEHIADLRGYDHILFIASLTAAYAMPEWRRLLVLVTAFTLGHSLTLVLATTNIVHADADLVEVLIPVTILVTSLHNMVDGAPGGGDTGQVPRWRRYHSVRYGLAGGFGLVHGLGFSTFLRAALGGEQSIAVPLLAFNVGLELGQLAIVSLLFLVGAVATRAARVPRRNWLLAVSAATAGIALVLLTGRLASLGG